MREYFKNNDYAFLLTTNDQICKNTVDLCRLEYNTPHIIAKLEVHQVMYIA